MLQRVAACCSVLQRAAACCSAVYAQIMSHIQAEAADTAASKCVLHCVLQCVAVWSSMFAVCCIALQCGAV